MPELPKREQYIDRQIHVSDKIFSNWRSKYPFNDSFASVPDLEFEPVNDVNTLGFYKVENVPFNQVTEEVIDTNTGEVTSTYQRPEVLIKTTFLVLNTLACQVTNPALYDTLNDPGDQLLWLET